MIHLLQVQGAQNGCRTRHGFDQAYLHIPEIPLLKSCLTVAEIVFPHVNEGIRTANLPDQFKLFKNRDMILTDRWFWGKVFDFLSVPFLIS